MIITINTNRKYDIEIRKGLIHNVGLRIMSHRPPGRICIIADENSDRFWGAPLRNSFEGMGFEIHNIVFPEGEKTKNFQNLEYIINYLAENRFSRSDALIGLGGGVIGDLTGFAASIYMRGIDFYNVPTTLLSAVDSSVGGKTAIDLSTGKNMAGTFWQPSGVFFDICTLSTLPQEQIKNGLGEVIKAGVILDDTIVSLLENNCTENLSDLTEDLISKSINVKKVIVQLDERENGPRQTLNLGHTIGHAVEKLSGYRISHGHAISIGLLIMAKISERMNWTSDNLSYRLEHLYRKYGFDLKCPYTPDQIAGEILSDKKRRGDTITLAVPLKIGQCSLKSVKVSEIRDLLVKGMVY